MARGRFVEEGKGDDYVPQLGNRKEIQEEIELHNQERRARAQESVGNSVMALSVEEFLKGGLLEAVR